MLKKLILLSFVCYFLGACTVLIPVHQVGSSQALKKGTLRWAGIIGTAPTIASTDENINRITPDDNDTGSYRGSSWVYGLTDAIDLELETASGGVFSGSAHLSIFGFKYQYLGLPEHSIYAKDQRWSAVVRSRVFFGKAEAGSCEGTLIIDTCDEGEADEYENKRDNRGFSIAHVWGYRLSPLWAVYGGFQFLQANVKLTKSFVQTEEASIEEKRKISLLGGVFGIKMSTYKDEGFNFFINLEISPSSVNATYFSKKIFSYTGTSAMGISYQF